MHRDPRIWALAALQAGMGIADWILPHTGVIFPFYWIPVILAAIFASPRQVALVGAFALALGICAGLHHGQWHAKPVEYTLILLAMVFVSAVAVVIAKRQREFYRLRLETAEKLVKEEELLRAVLEHVDAHIYMKDAEGRYIYVNPKVQKLLGRSPEKILGRTNEELLPPVVAEQVTAMDNEVFATGKTLRREEVLPDPDGKQHVFLSEKLRIGLPGEGHRLIGFSTDVTAQKEADTRLARREKQLEEVNNKLLVAQERLVMDKLRLRATLDSLLDPHVLMHPVRSPDGDITDFTIADANPAACAYNRLSREELVGKRVLELFPSRESSIRLEMYRNLMDSGRPIVLNDFVYTDENSGAGHHFDVRAVKVGDSISYTWRDVTERYHASRRLAESEELYRLLAENSSDVVLLLDNEGRIRWASPSLTPMLGWEPSEWIGRIGTEFLAGDGDADRYRMRNELLSRGAEPVLSRERMRARDGGIHWIETHASAHRGADGQINGIVATFRTIDAEVAIEDDLQRRAKTDQLTKLLNRHEAIDRLETLTGPGARTGGLVAVLFCDLDRFKEINDTRGHSAGDIVLEETANRLRAMLRATDDLAARLGGDEMLIVLNGVHDLEGAVQIAEALRRKASEPIPVSGGDVSITMSIGVTLARPGESTGAIIERADAAMYRAKSAGRNQVVTIDEAPVTRA